MSETLMEQCRLREQHKRRNACIAAIVTVVLVLRRRQDFGRRWQRIVAQYVQAEGRARHAVVVNSTAASPPPHRTGIPRIWRPRHRQCELLPCFDVDGVGHRRARNGTTRSQLNELLGSGSLADSDYQSLLGSINGQYSG